MPLPVLAPVATAIGTVVARFMPWIVGLVAGTTIARSDAARELFYKLLLELVTLFFGFLDIVFPAGVDNIGDAINAIPEQATVFFGYMRLGECFAILASGLAARLLRKLFLRF